MQGAPIHDVNKKVAEAVIHSRLSAIGIQKLLASLEVPPVCAKNIEKREEK